MEDVEPAVEELWRERGLLVEVTVSFDDVDVVAGCVEQDVTPVIGDGADVGPPVDEALAEVEVRSEQVVLADINVLSGDHLEDLFGRVEIAIAMYPGAREWRTL
ncbi:MAG: hypothetical protein KC544_15680, partial [Gemmatimonadetes bacterium]|nr:hypothetical protein [Gemmatimonadota bacterium]